MQQPGGPFQDVSLIRLPCRGELGLPSARGVKVQLLNAALQNAVLLTCSHGPFGGWEINAVVGDLHFLKSEK